MENFLPLSDNYTAIQNLLDHPVHNGKMEYGGFVTSIYCLNYFPMQLEMWSTKWAINFSKKKFNVSLTQCFEPLTLHFKNHSLFPFWKHIHEFAFHAHSKLSLSKKDSICLTHWEKSGFLPIVTHMERVIFMGCWRHLSGHGNGFHFIYILRTSMGNNGSSCFPAVLLLFSE